jgi:hypothetical protein
MNSMKIFRTMILTLSGAAMGLFGAFAELSSTPCEETWGIDRKVLAIATTPTTTYIGEDSTCLGPNTSFDVPIDARTGAPVATYPKVDSTVYAYAPDGAGGLYAGGSFIGAGTATRNNAAHILTDDKLNPAWSFNANPGSLPCVNALAVSGTTVCIGRDFTTIDGLSRQGFAMFETLCSPIAPSNSGATSSGANSITWTWSDNGI